MRNALEIIVYKCIICIMMFIQDIVTLYSTNKTIYVFLIKKEKSWQYAYIHNPVLLGVLSDNLYLDFI